MRRIPVVLAAATLAVVPAVLGLTGNPALSHSVPVRVPSNVLPVSADDLEPDALGDHDQPAGTRSPEPLAGSDDAPELGDDRVTPHESGGPSAPRGGDDNGTGGNDGAGGDNANGNRNDAGNNDNNPAGNPADNQAENAGADHNGGGPGTSATSGSSGRGPGVSGRPSVGPTASAPAPREDDKADHGGKQGRSGNG